MTISDIREKVKEIQKEVIKYDSKSKAGNQNCLLCAWVVEAYFRGVDILPRPVYSPRDIVFKKNGYDIIKDPIKIQIKNKNDAIRIIKNAGDESRFYIHVKWSASTQGGHEFNLINLNSKIYLIDGQAGLVCLINSKSAIIYFDGIDFSNSYMVRLDDKEFNQSILKYNKMKYLIMWDDSKDIPYITKHGLVNESALSSKSIHERVNDMDTTSFDIVMEFLEPTEEGLADLFKKKPKKPSFSSVTIESPIGPLHTIDKRNKESKPYLLETANPITFKVFGKEFSNVIRLNNIGTDESPKFDQKEVDSIKKAIQILPGKSNQIQKAVYEYHSQFEDELFGEYDYDDTKGFSPSVNQMKAVQGCAKYFDHIKLDLYLLYDNKPVVYLDMYNSDYYEFNSEGGIVCTILPKIVVDDWEGYPFEEAEE